MQSVFYLFYFRLRRRAYARNVIDFTIRIFITQQTFYVSICNLQLIQLCRLSNWFQQLSSHYKDSYTDENSFIGSKYNKVN